MIEKIRNRQGLLIVMIGFGMLGFLVPYDAVMALIGQGGNRDVGEVNGREISALEYQSELQERRRLGFNGDQLSEEVWNDLTTGIILNDDFEDVINEFDSPTTYFYLDPPYWKTENYYSNQDFDVSDHERLAEVLGKIEGKYSLSYYDFDILKEYYPKDTHL